MFRLALAEGLWLEPVETRHAEALADAVARTGDRLSAWEDWPATLKTAADARAWITRLRVDNAYNRGFTCGIWQHGRLVGLIGLDGVSPETLSGVLWGFVTPEVEGTRTAGLTSVGFLNFAFAELALARVSYYCARDNHRSLRLASRLGFTYEGLLASWRVVNNELVDFHLHRLLRGEWMEARRRFFHLRARAATPEDAPWLRGLLKADLDLSGGDRAWVVQDQAVGAVRWSATGVPMLDPLRVACSGADPGAGSVLLRMIETELRIGGASLVAAKLSDPAPVHEAVLRTAGFRPVTEDTWAKGL